MPLTCLQHMDSMNQNLCFSDFCISRAPAMTVGVILLHGGPRAYT